MVKRYDIADDDDSGDVSMMEFEDGEYVTFAEYDALAARLAEAERKIAGALRTAGGRWCEWGSRAESVRDILQGTTDSASGVQK